MLKSYATQTKSNHKRLHTEANVIFDDFHEDRERLIKCNSFRKLKYKTQVFSNEHGDYYRTRLTHTIEVAHTSRLIAGILGANQDLVEIIALAHDIGHPAFGHNGEDALSSAMKKYGGFAHNAQALKVVTFLEKFNNNFRGLNLTWESLEGIAKHHSPTSEKDKKSYIGEYNKIFNLQLDCLPGIEGQIVPIADEITYNHHDIEDGLRSTLITTEQIIELPIIGEEIKNFYNKPNDIKIAIKNSYNKTIKNLTQNTEKNIQKYNIKTEKDIRNNSVVVVELCPEFKEYHKIIKKFLLTNLYTHHTLLRNASRHFKIINELFNFFYNNPLCLPQEWQNLIPNNNYTKAQIVCDYISGMTDRYATQEYSSIST